MKKYLREEFIGKKVTVTSAGNKTLVGLKGTIIDETKHSLVIRTADGDKRVLKKGCVFDITFETKTVSIPGDNIELSSEERIKIK
jgi:ribonuclease P protein subunit POP4